MKTLKTLLASTAFSLLALAPLSSNATLILTLDDLSTAGVDVTIIDNGSLDIDSALSFLAYNGKVGSWSFNTTAGFGNGTSDIFGIDLLSGNASSSAGGTLRISLTETNLNYGQAPGMLPISSLIGGTTQGNVSYRSYADDTNAEFGKGMLLFSGSSSGGAFSNGSTVLTQLSDPFSLTLEVDITHVGKKTTSFDFASQIPEPTTLALLSVGLLAAGAASRRRRA
jgi:hypothetical protein